jgi:hypothetical protein
MDLSDQRRAMRVAATHAAKMAIDLQQAVTTMAATLPNRSEVEEIGARVAIAAIRRELDDLEHLIVGREPPVPLPTRAA